MIDLLLSVDETQKLVNCDRKLIMAVQEQLISVGLLKSVSDGIAGKQTLAAFARFKELEYLEYPALLGPSTAMALREATATHAVPKDATAPILPGYNKAFFPKIGWVKAGDRVHLGGNFSWGEFTKNLSRVPQNERVVNNILRLADYLEDVRALFGRSIILNSGYRPPAINQAVGGASNSQHLYGAAADIVVAGFKPHEVYQRLNSWHGNKGGLGDGESFTHIDLRGYRARFSYG